MIGIAIAVVLYIVWPDARPIIAALALLTVLGMVLSVVRR